MKILLTGASGLLGGAFHKVLAANHCTVAIVGREQLDIRQHAAVRALVASIAPSVVINCAAHTDVDAAELNPDPCFTVNALLPSLLASACREVGALLLHISSTGCYGDWKTDAYIDFDEPRPTTVHHRAKLAGERAVRESGCEHLILRTGWLFGGDRTQRKNFVWQRIVEARTRTNLVSDATQCGNPTFAPDVARQALKLVEAEMRGAFNVTSRGAATRFEYVASIIAAAGLPCKVEPGPAFRRLAAVSPNEVGRNYRLELLGLDAMPQWQASLINYVDYLLSEKG